MEETKKRGRPRKKAVEPQIAEPTVYITASYVKTSKGPAHHGDRVALPEDEASVLRARGHAK